MFREISLIWGIRSKADTQFGAAGLAHWPWTKFYLAGRLIIPGALDETAPLQNIEVPTESGGDLNRTIMDLN